MLELAEICSCKLSIFEELLINYYQMNLGLEKDSFQLFT